ncbi:MAG: D,D-heptose 1,7-bisphosphate phosphatase [Acetothermia bacterium 64_32]|nr:MAG: D,D-heptose 1,7-bisphosphate phosphatase [Acetothermia bacterium 64_32]HAF70893.1 D-glycero-beta-D-manno-heptose-1,7-bisphosphate 7-phosphatase [Candidatus Acetothermia bacterium]
MRRAVFLDRDGVLIRQVDGYLTRLEDMELLPGAAEAVSRLRGAGFLAVVVTNQAGVARGYLSRERLAELHRELLNRLRAFGTTLDGIYFCPHGPEEGCSCRKPAPGLLLQAARELEIDLVRSYMVGDATTDVEAAHRAGCFAILVRTGFAGTDGRSEEAPDAVVADLAAAADLILEREGP